MRLIFKILRWLPWYIITNWITIYNDCLHYNEMKQKSQYQLCRDKRKGNGSIKAPLSLSMEFFWNKSYLFSDTQTEMLPIFTRKKFIMYLTLFGG